MGKNELRKGMLISLEKIGMVERKKVEKMMQTNLFTSALWEKAEMIGITLSINKEWDTRAIIKQAWMEGKKVCIPKSIHKSRALHFYEVTSFRQIEKGYFDLLEPVVNETTRVDDSEIDLMIVPGLVFTSQGYRIGFGGGYYDRFLKDFKHTTASLLHSNQLVKSFPIESFDIPVQYLITEKKVMQAEGE